MAEREPGEEHSPKLLHGLFAALQAAQAQGACLAWQRPGLAPVVLALGQAAGAPAGSWQAEARVAWAPLLAEAAAPREALAALQGPLAGAPALPEAQGCGPAQALVGAEAGHAVAALRWVDVGGSPLDMVAHVNRGEAALALRLALVAAAALAEPEGG